MSDQFLGEIRAFGFNFAPVNWLQCNGQILPIQQYAALFSLLGTFYGGNGTTNFALPNLMGNVPMQWGSGAGLSTYFLGEPAGQPSVTITMASMPGHNHNVQVALGGATTATPGGSVWLGDSAPATSYVANGTLNTPLAQNAIGVAGNSLPHNNMQPYLVLNFCIALSGVFPSRG